jgi:UDPglucose 6-dehydrogenase
METVTSIIGMGIVGQAMYNNKKDEAKIDIYDLSHKPFDNSTQLKIKSNHVMYVCINIENKLDGTQDMSPMYKILNNIHPQEIDGKITIVVRSTLLPESFENIACLFPIFDIVYYPEFLNEISGNEDVKNQKNIILGGYGEPLSIVKKNIQDVFTFGDANFVYSDIKSASLMKYTRNALFASNIAFWEEIHNISGGHSRKIQHMIEKFAPVDPTFPIVGLDGYRGFGGKCLPKDLIAFANGIESSSIYFQEMTKFVAKESTIEESTKEEESTIEEEKKVINFKEWLEEQGVDSNMFWKNCKRKNQGWSDKDTYQAAFYNRIDFENIKLEDWIRCAFKWENTIIDIKLQGFLNTFSFLESLSFNWNKVLIDNPDAIIKLGFRK